MLKPSARKWTRSVSVTLVYFSDSWSVKCASALIADGVRWLKAKAIGVVRHTDGVYLGRVVTSRVGSASDGNGARAKRAEGDEGCTQFTCARATPVRVATARAAKKLAASGARISIRAERPKTWPAIAMWSR